MYAVATHIGHVGPEYSITLNAVGMLVGLAIGLAHGSWRANRPSVGDIAANAEDQEDDQEKLTVSIGEPVVQSENPYSPSRH